MEVLAREERTIEAAKSFSKGRPFDAEISRKSIKFAYRMILSRCAHDNFGLGRVRYY